MCISVHVSNKTISLLTRFVTSNPVLEGFSEPNFVILKGGEDLVTGAAHVFQLHRQVVDDVHDGGEVSAVDVDLDIEANHLATVKFKLDFWGARFV